MKKAKKLRELLAECDGGFLHMEDILRAFELPDDRHSHLSAGSCIRLVFKHLKKNGIIIERVTPLGRGHKAIYKIPKGCAAFLSRK